MLLSIGDQVRPGSYRLHSVFQRVVNFARRGRLVSVVDESVGPGPLNIVLRGRNADLQSGVSQVLNLLASAGVRARCGLQIRDTAACKSALRVSSRSVLFAGHRYRFTSSHRFNSTIELQTAHPDRFHNNLLVLGQALQEDAPAKSLAFLVDGKRRKGFRPGFERAYADQIEKGVRQAFRGRLLQGIGCLKGCGLGLTPGGDDFIAGLLIGLHVLQALHGEDYQPAREAIFRAARADNVFSNTFLDSACRGRVFGRLKDLLVALASGSAANVRRSARALFAVGNTSGADLATGLLMTLGSKLRQAQAGTPRRGIRSRPGVDVWAKRPYQALASLSLSGQAAAPMVGP